MRECELARLYARRWNVELDLRNIKVTLGMDVLSCRTPQMITKELWVHVLAYNLIRLLMAQAASVAQFIRVRSASSTPSSCGRIGPRTDSCVLPHRAMLICSG